MAEEIKIYHFTSNNEEDGWVAHTEDDGIMTGWYLRSKNYSQDYPPNTTYGGSLRMTATGAVISATENYWDLTVTWENLGVPEGMIVTNVKLDYLYRWICKGSGSGNNSTVEFADDEAGTGPAELRNSDGILQDTFSGRIYCIDRTAGDQWMHYPEDPNYPYDGAPEHTAYPIPEIPPSWGQAEGDTLSVPEAMQSSDTTLLLQ